MAPYCKATELHYVSSPATNIKIYQGAADPFWAQGTLPNGGYVAGIMVTAGMKNQELDEHKDPIHATVHYLSGTLLEPFEVHVRHIRKGKSFSNLSAKLIQRGTVRVRAQFIFGVTDPGDRPPLEPAHTPLYPPEPHARVTPLSIPPSGSTVVELPKELTFSPYILWSLDPSVPARHDRRTAAGDGDGGAEGGRYFMLRDPADKLTPNVLPFFADVCSGLLHFKRGRPSRRRDAHNGVYGTSRFVDYPQGRHNSNIELWTTPDDTTSEPGELGNWKPRQRCLLVASQVMLAVPVKGKKERRAS
ncbi:thioesterase-like superfamily-domain-containing protein [Gloeopeniophorella convolvens]|nr:thioesterase-like superfamily-domain-containing protein [Gloeopeniophorella convolvens]